MTKTMRIALFAMLSATLGLAACGGDDGDDNNNDTDTGMTEDVTPDGDETPTCDDGEMNGDEEGVDCGGSCDACEVEATCDDGEMNGDETGVDCGGSCDACDVEATCDDGEMNGDEEGIDCGGSCEPCATEETCDGAAADGSDLTFQGECAGDVARWCYEDNTIGSVDCSEEGLTCDWISEDFGYYCVVPEGGECGGGNCAGSDSEPACIDGICELDYGTCDDETFEPTCDGDVALFACSNTQPVGETCDAGMCDAGACLLADGAECFDPSVGPGNCAEDGSGCFIESFSDEDGSVDGSSCMADAGTCTPVAEGEEFDMYCVDDMLVVGCSDDGEPWGLDCAPFGPGCVDGLCLRGEDEECNPTQGVWDCEPGYICADQDAETGWGVCAAGGDDPTCDDGIQNGDEEGVDCGGSVCDACAADPTCDDGIQNGDEEGVDCGGSVCDACATENADPVIDTFTPADDAELTVGSAVDVLCAASDADGDDLTLVWSADPDVGEFTGITDTVPNQSEGAWMAPMEAGTVVLTCTVTDGNGGEATQSVTITVNAL